MLNPLKNASGLQMTLDKAYIIGLLVGGGQINNKSFSIKLPLKKWGLEPQNMNRIATDILTKIQSKFQKEYNISVTYTIGSDNWTITPLENSAISDIQDDLRNMSLPDSGILLERTKLDILKKSLQSPFDEVFLSGIFDTRASVVESHRRFNSNAPVVSIEIPGSIGNFQFVIDICSWLTSKGSVTDQILFNHPCQHSPSDPSYKSWKKGYKIRFLANSFLENYSFAIQSKSNSIITLQKKQDKFEQKPCIDRKISKPSPVSLHEEINSSTLPEEVRSKLFFHYFHFCALYGCPYAPVEEIKKLVDEYENYIFILPRMQKGEFADIYSKYIKLKNQYFSNSTITVKVLSVSEILDDQLFEEYHETKQALAYLVTDKLNGKRHAGAMKEILYSHLSDKIEIQADFLTRSPMLLKNTFNDRAVIISSISSSYNLDKIHDLIEVKECEVKYNG